MCQKPRARGELIPAVMFIPKLTKSIIRPPRTCKFRTVSELPEIGQLIHAQTPGSCLFDRSGSPGCPRKVTSRCADQCRTTFFPTSASASLGVVLIPVRRRLPTTSGYASSLKISVTVAQTPQLKTPLSVTNSVSPP